MRVIDYAPYVMGAKSPWEITKKVCRADKDLLKMGAELLEVHPTAMQNLKVLKSPRIFYAQEPDMANDIGGFSKEELFYALKLGFASDVAPAKLLYFIKTAYEEYGSPNFIFKICLERDLQDFLSAGYLASGYNLRDVICSVTKINNYTPLSEGKLAVPVEDHWDVYITSEDAIAMMPEELKNMLSHADIEKLKVSGGRIYLGQKPITQLGRYVGAVNSCYDLRGLL